MNIKKTLFFSAILLLILSIVFYMKTMPYYMQSQAYFMQNQGSLESVVKLFVKNDNISLIKLKLEGGLVIKNKNGIDQVVNKKELDNYGDLISTSKLSPIRRLPEKISFFIGSKRKFNKTFNISYDYIFDIKNIDLACNDNYDTQKHGICTHLLDKNWVLRYEWISI